MDERGLHELLRTRLSTPSTERPQAISRSRSNSVPLVRYDVLRMSCGWRLSCESSVLGDVRADDVPQLIVPCPSLRREPSQVPAICFPSVQKLTYYSAGVGPSTSPLEMTIILRRVLFFGLIFYFWSIRIISFFRYKVNKIKVVASAGQVVSYCLRQLVST